MVAVGRGLGRGRIGRSVWRCVFTVAYANTDAFSVTNAECTDRERSLAAVWSNRGRHVYHDRRHWIRRGRHGDAGRNCGFERGCA